MFDDPTYPVKMGKFFSIILKPLKTTWPIVACAGSYNDRNTPRFLTYALPTRPYLIPIRLDCFIREIISNFVGVINKNSVNICIHAVHTDTLP